MVNITMKKKAMKTKYGITNYYIYYTYFKKPMISIIFILAVI